MGRISRLSLELANQIAAGEVVERPASVVKELLENALDAGATRIGVAIESGGKDAIRVEDDGEGMDPEDAALAVERHATSKIARAADLAAIVTLGFRGEALPAIASVSHLVLRTREHHALSGTEVRVNGGLLASVRDAGMPAGTIVAVGQLFYNLPARRKFLKSDGAESAQVSRVVTQVALAYPEVGFALTSGGRTLLACPPVGSRHDRFFQVYGDRPDLVRVAWEAGDLRVTGYVAALAEQGPTRGPQHVFVNRRIVRDRAIAHAITDAYLAASIKERSPEVHLFFEIPADQVDVNVHPTKAEVRFRDQSLVHQITRRAVGAAIGAGPAPALQLRPPAASLPDGVAITIPGLMAGDTIRTTATPVRPAGPSWPLAGPPGAGGASNSGAGPVTGLEPAATAVDLARIRPMVPLGQFRDTFILAVDDEGIAIVDQHVAHERVLFERVMERISSGRLESQRLLDPIVMQLPPESRQALAAHGAELERLGFEVGEFGRDSVRVTAVPALLGPGESEAAIRAVAGDLEALDRGSRVEAALRRIAATTACHAAVKAHDRLTLEKMAHILDELRRTAYSTVCPHGRPVMLRLTRREIEKNFQRI